MDSRLVNWTDIVFDKLNHWAIAFIAMLPNIVLAAVAFVAFIFLAKFTRNLFYKIILRLSHKESISRLFSSILSMLVSIIGLFIALNILQLNKAVSSLLAGAGIIGLALGFAFQDLTANFISGIFMIFKRPFEVGEVLETNGFTGTVEDIQLRTTTIYTYQGLHLVLPNKDIFQKPIINHSRSEDRRIEFTFSIPVEQDLDKVVNVTKEALDKLDFLTPDKPKQTFYTEIEDKAVKLVIWCWIPFHKTPSYMEGRHRAVISIINAYKQQGIIVVSQS
ncbi:MAG: MscS Mechanosensitive ion channel [Chitinophagaceae bacterium]|nr:MscS Mechanosensitive ion channel [Chitinophagaceae bacterium]